MKKNKVKAYIASPKFAKKLDKLEKDYLKNPKKYPRLNIQL